MMSEEEEESGEEGDSDERGREVIKKELSFENYSMTWHFHS